MQQTKIKCPIKFTFRKERKRSIEKEREEELRRRDCCVTDADAHVEPTTVHSLLGRLCSLNGHAASVG